MDMGEAQLFLATGLKTTHKCTHTKETRGILPHYICMYVVRRIENNLLKYALFFCAHSPLHSLHHKHNQFDPYMPHTCAGVEHACTLQNRSTNFYSCRFSLAICQQRTHTQHTADKQHTHTTVRPILHPSNAAHNTAQPTPHAKGPHVHHTRPMRNWPNTSAPHTHTLIHE